MSGSEGGRRMNNWIYFSKEGGTNERGKERKRAIPLLSPTLFRSLFSFVGQMECPWKERKKGVKRRRKRRLRAYLLTSVVDTPHCCCCCYCFLSTLSFPFSKPDGWTERRKDRTTYPLSYIIHIVTFLLL